MIEETEVAIEMQVSTFHKMEKLATHLNLSNENYKLIALRFSELLIHFKFSSFSFENLFKKEEKKQHVLPSEKNLDEEKYNLILEKRRT